MLIYEYIYIIIRLLTSLLILYADCVIDNVHCTYPYVFSSAGMSVTIFWFLCISGQTAQVIDYLANTFILVLSISN